MPQVEFGMGQYCGAQVDQGERSALVGPSHAWRQVAVRKPDLMGVRFEWADDKARQNVEKHGVSFEEAATVFEDPLSLTIPDAVHSTEEPRFVTLGESAHGRLRVVVHTDRGGSIRIISARQATRRERRNYEAK